MTLKSFEIGWTLNMFGVAVVVTPGNFALVLGPILLRWCYS